MSALMRVAVLGSTGSIGVNTLDVLAASSASATRCSRSPRAATSRACASNACKHRPRFAVVVDDVSGRARWLRSCAAQARRPRCCAGRAGIERDRARTRSRRVMAAIVGAAGLASSLAAARAGKRILLANKEALVMSGPLFMHAVRDGGATLIPVDSEHNAIFQCMARQTARPGVRPRVC